MGSGAVAPRCVSSAAAVRCKSRETVTAFVRAQHTNTHASSPASLATDHWVQQRDIVVMMASGQVPHFAVCLVTAVAWEEPQEVFKGALVPSLERYVRPHATEAWRSVTPVPKSASAAQVDAGVGSVRDALDFHTDDQSPSEHIGKVFSPLMSRNAKAEQLRRVVARTSTSSNQDGG